jgi:hypothetical protein
MRISRESDTYPILFAKEKKLFEKKFIFNLELHQEKLLVRLEEQQKTMKKMKEKNIHCFNLRNFFTKNISHLFLSISNYVLRVK